MEGAADKNELNSNENGDKYVLGANPEYEVHKAKQNLPSIPENSMTVATLVRDTTTITQQKNF